MSGHRGILHVRQTQFRESPSLVRRRPVVQATRREELLEQELMERLTIEARLERPADELAARSHQRHIDLRGRAFIRKQELLRATALIDELVPALGVELASWAGHGELDVA